MLFYTDGYRWPHWKENTEAEIRRGQRVHTLNVHRDEALRVGCQGSRNVPKRSGSQRIRNVEASVAGAQRERSVSKAVGDSVQFGGQSL